ncbi:glycosyltransferase family 2 protein [Leeuwenhoekiella sp. NPDC079379]|uniref:glycosyltransferase family 2 protein n=1 Tax=Leeuwenhoekiella sp. NPDC079379 TaxID=3364122 RepID=UPI0037C8A319
MTDPLVSIIIPTYNRAHLIGETLDSVLVQTYENWECIVVDDGSTDETAELLASYVQKDSRFQYHRRPSKRPKGANACRNYGFELSKGEFIQWLDSDDLLGSTKIAAQLNNLLKEDCSSLATSYWYDFKSSIEDSTLVDCGSAYASHLNIKSFLNALGETYGYLPPHAYLMNKEIVKKAGFWNEKLSINQDGEMMIRVFLKSKKIVFCENAQIYYRVAGSDNTSKINSLKKAADAVESWKKIRKLLKRNNLERNMYLRTNLKHLRINLIKDHEQFVLQNPSLFDVNKGFLARIQSKFFSS